MDGRGWPWKKKSSDKATTEKAVVGNESTGVVSLSSLASLENQEKCKNANYVQITMDSYTHMSRMEDRVKLFEVEVKDLKEKLCTAQSEIKTKESVILQHAKVAEEAVTGWEKADAETLALKRQLESVTLLKLTAEDRASHLDDALKECTRQIRIVKDESDQKLHDVILAKSTQWNKIKAELEGKIDDMNQRFQRAASDNAALTRSLQERSEMIVRITEERSKAEAEVETLKTNIQLADKEINSLKYDVHVARKEVEIRNEEKNMSLRSADIANKQYLEGVKKIAKLEAECQRLRGLLRRKLPGPAAMAQMKLEVESLGNEFTDSRTQRNMVQNHSHHTQAKPEISADKWEECKNENAYLTNRVLEMEEEIQTLKELLSARNNDLQVSRNVSAKNLGKLKILEEQVHMYNNEKNVPSSNNKESPSSGHDNYPPSVTSVSEDGIDEEVSSSEHGPANSTGSYKSRKVSGDGSCKPRISNRLELMDDFLEVEKLAANDADEANSASKSCNSGKSLDKESAVDTTVLDQLLSVLWSRINRIFETQEGISTEKILEATRFSIFEMQGQLSDTLSEVACTDAFCQVPDETLEKHVLSSQDTKHSDNIQNPTKQDLEAAVSNIHHFIISSTTREENEQSDFSLSVGKFSLGELSLSYLILELSSILLQAKNKNNGALDLKHHNKETTLAESSPAECIDEITLVEKEVDKSDSEPLEHRNDNSSGSKIDTQSVDNSSNGHGIDDSSSESLLKELEQVKLEKDNTALELTRCLQNLEEKDQFISELKSQVTSSVDLQSLAETQLKCVTESYKSLELRTKELEAKVKSLEEETQRLEMAFSKEKHDHSETLTLCKNLQEKLQRNETCRKCSSSISQSKPQSNQDKDIASATEKLTACQETIHLLSQQLQALKPQETNHITKSQSLEKLQLHKTSETTPNHSDPRHEPSHSFRYAENPSLPTVDTIIKSSSISSSSKEDIEKHTRGLGRFFSSKSKNNGR